jgi:hypothetical protein
MGFCKKRLREEDRFISFACPKESNIIGVSLLHMQQLLLPL